MYQYVCSADGSTHREQQTILQVKHRARPNLSSRQRPKRAPIRQRSRRRQRRGEPHTEHGLGSGSPEVVYPGVGGKKTCLPTCGSRRRCGLGFWMVRAGSIDSFLVLYHQVRVGRRVTRKTSVLFARAPVLGLCFLYFRETLKPCDSPSSG